MNGKEIKAPNEHDLPARDQVEFIMQEVGVPGANDSEMPRLKELKDDSNRRKLFRRGESRPRSRKHGKYGSGRWRGFITDTPIKKGNVQSTEVGTRDVEGVHKNHFSYENFDHCSHGRKPGHRPAGENSLVSSGRLQKIQRAYPGTSGYDGK